MRIVWVCAIIFTPYEKITTVRGEKVRAKSFPSNENIIEIYVTLAVPASPEYSRGRLLGIVDVSLSTYRISIQYLSELDELNFVPLLAQYVGIVGGHGTQSWPHQQGEELESGWLRACNWKSTKPWYGPHVIHQNEKMYTIYLPNTISIFSAISRGCMRNRVGRNSITKHFQCKFSNFVPFFFPPKWKYILYTPANHRFFNYLYIPTDRKFHALRPSRVL
jgi:hypothetical protein